MNGFNYVLVCCALLNCSTRYLCWQILVIFCKLFFYPWGWKIKQIESLFYHCAILYVATEWVSLFFIGNLTQVTRYETDDVLVFKYPCTIVRLRIHPKKQLYTLPFVLPWDFHCPTNPFPPRPESMLSHNSSHRRVSCFLLIKMSVS